jgi:hypothetical protein
MTKFIKVVRKTSCNKEIVVIDNAFDVYEMEHFYLFLENSLYNSLKFSSKARRDVPINTLMSVYDKQDHDKFGLLKRAKIAGLIPNENLTKGWANLGPPGTFITSHTDIQDSLSSGVTLIYCANLFWEDHFGGDLIFCNSIGEKEVVVGFKPGRVILFDSTIPHLITATCGIAPVRYAYVAGFEEKISE